MKYAQYIDRLHEKSIKTEIGEGIGGFFLLLNFYDKFYREPLIKKGILMRFYIFRNWVVKNIPIKKRLINICVAYLLSLMVQMRKHSLDEAARFSRLNKSQFSKFLKNHSKEAVYSLDELSKRQSKQFSKILRNLKEINFWKIALIIDSTTQGRSSKYVENAQKLNHGKGFVIGHQWTNVVLFINDMIIPLPPIPYYTKKYCRENDLEYKTEHKAVIEYINNLNLNDYVGFHCPDEVVVLGDSGYDDKDIQKAIDEKKWKFIIALKKTRSVKSRKEYQDTPKTKGWTQVSAFFKNHRRLPWQTVRITANGNPEKRMDFRVRQVIGYLRYVGRVQLVCSEFKKRPDGRRKYLACNDIRATARQILIGYRIRWSIELFHKEVKTYLGFEDVATHSFDSVKAHVHWVYCAYILLSSDLPGVPRNLKTVVEKQRRIRQIVENKEKGRVLQQLTQFGGVERYKKQLREAL